MKVRGVAIVAGLVMTTACGGAEGTRNEQAARQIEQGAEKIQQGAETMAEGAKRGSADMAAGLQQMAQGLQQMAQGAAKAVPYESLIALLPEIPGWTRGEPKGESVTAPMAFSRAEARYTNDGGRMTVEITDTALSQFLIAPISMFLSSGYAEQSTDGFKRATRVAGQPGFESWSTPSRRGEVTVFVASRYLVKASADDVADVATARQAVEAVDFGKLAALQ
jgi:hypothetical protein